jgi:hypothetical protein
MDNNDEQKRQKLERMPRKPMNGNLNISSCRRVLDSRPNTDTDFASLIVPRD